MISYRIAAALLLVASAPVRLDSQTVLSRYVAAVAAAAIPKAEIFIYDVSQAGPTNIEQRHEIYRSGIEVRDEILAQNGIALKRKVVHITRRADAYMVSALAPRPYDYELTFVAAASDSGHVDYTYKATPLRSTGAGFVVDGVTIDGRTFLPREIEFHSSSGLGVTGSGRILFGSAGDYWVPTLATVTTPIGKTVARERIVFSAYRFPPSLPRSTFL